MRKTTLHRSALSLVAALLLSVPATADEPGNAPDRAWITTVGTITGVSAGRFGLDYGEGEISVEMDDWDAFDESRHLKAGDRVAVFGRVDADLYQRRSIEASTVYVFASRTFYFASERDEEDAHAHGFEPPEPADGSWLRVTGTIRDIDGRTFVIDSAGARTRVDTVHMSYDPLDDEGLQRLRVGDRVRVSGLLEQDYFDRLAERRTIRAKSIVKLAAARKRR